MKRTMKKISLFLVLSAGLALFQPAAAQAHCDTMDGPVISAAREALETGNVNLVLIWVQPDDEKALRREFEKALAAKKAGGSGKEAAEQRFFEELVRIHRAGEGAPYTGIKPAGSEVEPAVRAADEALEAGSAEKVKKLVSDAVSGGIQKHFEAAMAKRGYSPDDVAAGRSYVKAYVEYVHFVEGLDKLATATDGHHGHGEEHAGHSGHAGHLPWLLAGLLGLLLVAETLWIVFRRRPRSAQPAPQK